MESIQHANFCALRLEDLLVVRWHGRTTAEAAERAAQVVRDMAAERGPCVLLLVHDASDPPPTAGGVRVIFGFVPELLRITRFRVALVQGEGFGAAVIHATYGRISLLSSTSVYAKEVPAAMRRVAPAAKMSPEALERALNNHSMLV